MAIKAFSEGLSLSDAAQNDEPAAENLPPLHREDLRREETRNVWRSEDLLGSQCEAVIVHRGQEYRLRCTRQGKLILFK